MIKEFEFDQPSQKQSTLGYYKVLKQLNKKAHAPTEITNKVKSSTGTLFSGVKYAPSEMQCAISAYAAT